MSTFPSISCSRVLRALTVSSTTLYFQFVGFSFQYKTLCASSVRYYTQLESLRLPAMHFIHAASVCHVGVIFLVLLNAYKIYQAILRAHILQAPQATTHPLLSPPPSPWVIFVTGFV